ncbi:hypothetical protein [Streptomyces sp. NPDC046985]|uniref:hypothetical protein n=1 Tax=Streptomyces sp. NPDC046985 TaxID=3155377 RepID=UPI0033C7CFAD
MICGHCDHPIHPDQRYTSFIPDSATGAAATAYLHAERCPPVPHQEYPSERPVVLTAEPTGSRARQRR